MKELLTLVIFQPHLEKTCFAATTLTAAKKPRIADPMPSEERILEPPFPYISAEQSLSKLKTANATVVSSILFSISPKSPARKI